MVYKKQNVQYFYISIDLYCFKCTRDEYLFVCADVMKHYQYPDMQINFYNPLGKKY